MSTGMIFCATSGKRIVAECNVRTSNCRYLPVSSSAAFAVRAISCKKNAVEQAEVVERVKKKLGAGPTKKTHMSPRAFPREGDYSPHPSLSFAKETL